MGIIRTTAYPSKYKDWEPEEKEPVEMQEPAADEFWISVELKGGRGNEAARQRQASQILGKALGEKPVYDRFNGFYTVGGWLVNGMEIRTAPFPVTEVEKNVAPFQQLEAAGFHPDDGISLNYIPEEYNIDVLYKMLMHMEMRRGLIEKALGVGDEGFSLVIRTYLECWMALNDFKMEELEAGASLVRQLCLHSASIRNVRLNAKQNTNEKYQMRTWLLRLGFIGDEFARQRKTLLSNLDGDTAFCTESSKQKATQKRKAKQMEYE